MEVIGLLCGGAPVLKKYQIAATTIAGIPLMTPASSAGGLAAATTTSAADMVGVTLDSATYTTTQGTGASSAERLVTVVINPDAIIKIKMSGGATEDTALALQEVTTASSGGTAVTTAASWTSAVEYDEGVTWGYDGANIGQFRKITATSSTAGTVVIPFDYGTVVGDNFLRAPYWPMGTINVQLSTLLTQANAIISVGTGAEFRVIDLDLKDVSDSGRTNSFVIVVPGDHLLNTTA